MQGYRSRTTTFGRNMAGARALLVSVADLTLRRQAMNERGAAAWMPNRKREVSTALRAYGMMATSAAKGAVRDIDQLVERHKL